MGATTHFGVVGKDKIYGSLDGGVPLVFFDRYSSGNTMVISPLDSFMDVNQATWTTAKKEDVIGFGPIGSLKSVRDMFVCVCVCVCVCVRVCVRACVRVFRCVCP